MTWLVSTLVPLLITAVVLAGLMLVTMGIGWVSGKLIKRLLGIEGR